MKKTLCLCLAVFISVVLCGCQLAKGEADAAYLDDRLAGVFITKEYLDLFDFDGYLNDNIEDIINDGNVEVTDNSGKYDGRIYVEKKLETTTNDEGEVIEHYEYEVPDFEGILYIYAIENMQDGEGYGYFTGDDALFDVMNTSGSNNIMECTLYMDPAKFDTICVNPVYQNANGDIYIVSGEGMSGSGTEDGEFKQTLEQKDTIDIDGQVEEKETKITVHVKFKHPSFGDVTVVKMGVDNKPIDVKEYTVGQLPESMKLGEDVDYLLLESMVTMPEGKMLRRELIQRGAEYFNGYKVREDGIFEGQMVSLEWGNES